MPLSDRLATQGDPAINTKRTILLGLHWLLIIFLVTQCAYASWMIFVELALETTGPLFGAARSMPHELMVTRRLYAIEFWIAFVGLALYLALTEIGPRLRRDRTAAE